MQLQLSQALLASIHNDLQSAFPNEGGGFLVGNIQDGTHIVLEVHSVENVFAEEEQFHRFLAESGAYERIEDMADAKGLALLGYFHSHPNAPAIPSEFDRVHAWPHFAYLIVSVRNGQAAEARLWALKDDRSAFDEATLVISQ